MKLYARYGIAHFWIVDPEARTVEALELDGNLYRLVAAYGADTRHAGRGERHRARAVRHVPSGHAGDR